MAPAMLALIFAPPSDADDTPSGRVPRHQHSAPIVETLPDDATIITRARAGDNHIIEQLFRAYASALATFAATYVRSDDTAWEIVQDVFLWLIAHQTSWRVIGTVRSYLFSATRNAALNSLKHSAVERRWMQRTRLEFSSSDDTRIHEAMPDDEQRRALYAALSKLAESRRTALALRYGHDMSYAEIAAVLGSSVKAVENQLNRTLRQLRELLTSK